MTSSFVQFGLLSPFSHGILNDQPWCTVWVAQWECLWLHFPPGSTFDLSDTSCRFAGLLLVSFSIAFRWVSILKFLDNMVSAVTILSASDLAYNWRSWSDVPVIFLHRRPLTTLGCPTPTAVVGSQWGELGSEAFATDTHIAGSSVTVASPAAPNGQLLVLTVSEAVNPNLSCWGRGMQGRAGVTSLSSSSGCRVMFAVCRCLGEYWHHVCMCQ